jgi:hypothetical protein
MASISPLVLNLSPYHKQLLKNQAEEKSLSMNAYVMYLLMLEENKKLDNNDK